MPRKRRLYGMWIFKLRSLRPRSKIGRSQEHSIMLCLVSKAVVVCRRNDAARAISCLCRCCCSPADQRYQSLFGKRAVSPLFRAPVPILADERASIEKGTGILMVCTFGDATDVEWWRQFDLPRAGSGKTEHLQFGSPGWESLDPDAANVFYGRCKGNTSSKRGGPSLIFSARKEASCRARSAIDPRASAYRTCRQVLRER